MKRKKPKFDGSKLFFTSDPHFFHKRMVLPRGFKTKEEMNDQLTLNWNSKVGPDDDVICMGDYSFGGRHETYTQTRRLNGRKWWIKGNHDDGLITEPSIQTLFQWTGYYLEIDVLDEDAENGKQRIICFHYNQHIWNKMQHGAWHVYGHSHGNSDKDANRSMDVGVDPNNLFPVSYRELKTVMATKTFIPRDHHGDPLRDYYNDSSKGTPK